MLLPFLSSRQSKLGDIRPCSIGSQTTNYKHAGEAASKDPIGSHVTKLGGGGTLGGGGGVS